MLLAEKTVPGATTPPPRRGARVLFTRTVYRYFTVSTTPRRLIGAGVFTTLLLALVLVHTNAFLTEAVPQGRLLYGLCLAAVAILGGLTAFRWGINHSRVATVVSTAVVALLPVVAMTMVECLNGVFIWNWSPQTLGLNYVLYLLFYGTVYVLSGSYRLPMLIVNPLLFLLALTNYYVYAFRGTPFVPMDFFAATTAANVATAYDFSFNYQVVISLLLLAFLTVAGYKLRTPAFQFITKVASRVFFATLTVAVVCIYSFTDLYAKAGLAPDFWNQARGYHYSGVVMNFCLNTKYVSLKAPSGYTPEDTDDLMAAVLGEEPEALTSSAATAETPPNIICIMNESLADMSVLGNVHTNIPYMPFLNSLRENTVRGNLVVPVIGSGTSNTEFEFLTGVSTCFFPAGSNAYMLYVDEPLPSLVSTMMGQGYSSRAFHPYYASGWNRLAVYDHFGFSRFTSLGSVVPNSILSQYAASGSDVEVLIDLVEAAYPGENTLLRQYVSDSRNYREVIDLYESRNREEPFFLFNVTMQNHGGYTSEASNFQTKVWLTDLAGNALDVYPKANQFLSLMKYSDDAFAELIAYFEQVEEPTVICLFGDHQPNVETGYVKELMGVDSLYDLSAEEELKRYTTPFYIWANYDIPEETVDKLSVNYLSSYVLKVAGVELPAYNQYLLKLSETLPVISNVGCYDKEGIFYTSGKDSPYRELLAGYQKIAYNYITDTDNRQERLFRIN